MNRLIESGGGDVSEPGMELLRRTPPTGPMPALKRRVWASLQARQIRATRRFRLLGLPALAMGATVMALAGSAGAVIMGRWIMPALERPAARPVGTRTDRVHSSRRVVAQPSSRREAMDEGGASVSAEIDEEVGTPPPRRAALAPARAASRSAVPSARSAATEAQASAQERTEVLDALIALRRNHDPRRAGALLDRYLAAHRHGALREEALALAIEAADGRGDQAASERLARAYEAQFADGRFHQFARKHLESVAPGSRAATGGLDGTSVVATPVRNKE